MFPTSVELRRACADQGVHQYQRPKLRRRVVDGQRKSQAINAPAAFRKHSPDRAPLAPARHAASCLQCRRRDWATTASVVQRVSHNPACWKKFDVGTRARISCGIVTISKPLPSPVKFITSSSAAASERRISLARKQNAMNRQVSAPAAVARYRCRAQPRGIPKPPAVFARWSCSLQRLGIERLNAIMRLKDSILRPWRSLRCRSAYWLFAAGWRSAGRHVRPEARPNSC